MNPRLCFRLFFEKLPANLRPSHLLAKSFLVSFAISFLIFSPSPSLYESVAIPLGIQKAAAAEIIYIYDELGRLKAVVDPASDTAVYNYDPVGNLTGISRQLSSQVSIIDFTPNSGPTGTTVTIYGTGFSTTPSQNTVTFNGIAATPTSATATQIVTSAPTGATTGPIAVMTSAGSATSSTVFTIVSQGPDLVPTALSAPSSAGSGQTISVSWAVANQGTVTAVPSGSNWVDRIYFSTDSVCCSGDTFLGQVGPGVLTTLAAGASYIKTISATLPVVPAGNYYLIVSTDNNNDVPESDETNNQKVFLLTITTPDLVPTALSAPSSAESGQTISVSWTVANQGTGTAIPSASNWVDRLYFSTDNVCCNGDTFLGQAIDLTALAAGGSYNRTKDVTLPVVAGGNYYLFSVTDNNNDVFESNETNNQRMVPITITAPDLVPTALSAPSSAGSGQTISVSWTVANQGTATAVPLSGSNWVDRLYFSTDNVCCSGDTFLGQATDLTTLAAGGSYSRTKDVALPVVAGGAYYLFVVTDVNDNVFESDETNNQMVVQITITAPDLVPTALSAPSSAGAGQSISVSWTIANQGTGTAVPLSGSNWVDNLYFSTDNVCCSGDTFLGRASPTTLAAGGSYTETISVTLPVVPGGSYYLFITADFGVNVFESNETNNQMMTPITVSP